MSYEIVVTFTKNSDSPADAFKTMPALIAGFEGLTQSQIDALNEQYPSTRKVVEVFDQRIVHETYPSKEVFDLRDSDPVLILFREQRKAWAQQNNITIDFRVL